MSVTREHILEIFSSYGHIKSLEMSIDQRPSRVSNSKTFQIASVQYKSSSAAARARKYSHGGSVQIILIDKAVTDTEGRNRYR